MLGTGGAQRGVLVLILASSCSTLPLAKAALSTAEKEAFIKCHNTARATSSLTVKPDEVLGNVVWDFDLSSLAQRWADQCGSWSRSLEHSTQAFRSNVASACEAGNADSGAKFSYVGENLAQGTGDYTPERACNGWAGEQQDWKMGSKSCTSGKVCGHWTQMVWKQSRYIGCGSNMCSGARTYVCIYGPGGNYQGEAPYVTCSGQTCTAPKLAAEAKTGTRCVWSVDGSTTPALEESDSGAGRGCACSLALLSLTLLLMPIAMF